MTAEQQKALEVLAQMVAATVPKTAGATTNTAVVHNHIIAARDLAVKAVSELNKGLAAITGGDTMPTVTDTVTVPSDQWPKPDPIVPEPTPEPEKASKWGKFKSVFKKVWPVAAVAAAFIPGAPLVVGAVNAALSTTADPTTAGVVGGAAGVTALITAGVSEYRKQAAAEKPKE